MKSLSVDYYPEHWKEERWETDLEMMRKAGITAIRIGEFAWCKMEPSEEQYDFTWLDTVITKAASKGIAVILCTPTAAPPAWLIQKHPDLLPVAPNGHRMTFGHRRHYCIHHPVYRLHTERMVAALGEAFGHRREVIAWQVDNEFGGGGRCTCEICRKAFQDWLRNRYATLEQLNDAWGTIFWSQCYTDWAQIPVVTSLQSSHPGLHLDFRRFHAHSFAVYNNLQVDILRKLSPGKVITTNVWLFRWGDTMDHVALARNLDLISFDNYSDEPHEGAFYNDFYRSISGRYWILEQKSAWPHAQYLYPDMKNRMALFTWQAFARKAELISYFRWRQGLFGHEQNHGAILDHTGEPGPVYQKASDIGTKLDSVRHLQGEVKATIRVGVYFSYEDCWSMGIQNGDYDDDSYKSSTYTDRLIHTLYKSLYELNIPVTFVFTPRQMAGLDLLLVPMKMIHEEELAEAIRQFVKNGGSALFTCDLGRKDGYNKFREERVPQAFRELLGIDVLQHYVIRKGEIVRVELEGAALAGYDRFDVVKTGAAKALACFRPEGMEETPAITVNHFEKGNAYYLATYFDADSWKCVLKFLMKETFHSIPAECKGVEIVRQRTPDGELTCFINFGEDSEMEWDGRRMELKGGQVKFFLDGELVMEDA